MEENEGTMLVSAVQVAVVLATFLLAVPGGTSVVRRLLDRIDAPRTSGHDQDHVPGITDADQDLAGGYWIGLLERAALFACVVAAFPAGIAVVLGVKSIGRYPELRTPTGRKGELFIIGTFASMLWAALWAGCAYAIVWWWR